MKSINPPKFMIMLKISQNLNNDIGKKSHDTVKATAKFCPFFLKRMQWSGFLFLDFLFFLFLAPGHRLYFTLQRAGIRRLLEMPTPAAPTRPAPG